MDKCGQNDCSTSSLCSNQLMLAVQCHEPEPASQIISGLAVETIEKNMHT